MELNLLLLWLVLIIQDYKKTFKDKLQYFEKCLYPEFWYHVAIAFTRCFEFIPEENLNEINQKKKIIL